MRFFRRFSPCYSHCCCCRWPPVLPPPEWSERFLCTPVKSPWHRFLVHSIPSRRCSIPGAAGAPSWRRGGPETPACWSVGGAGISQSARGGGKERTREGEGARERGRDVHRQCKRRSRYLSKFPSRLTIKSLHKVGGAEPAWEKDSLRN